MSRIVVKDERRNQIILALRDCLTEKSYAETSVKDIAKKADLTPGLIHYYFESKDEILLMLYESASNTYYDSLIRWIETLPQKKMTLQEFSFSVSEYLKSSYNSSYSAVYSSIWAIGNYMPALHEKLFEKYKRYENTLTEALASILPDDTDVHTFAKMFHIYLDGLAVLSSIYGMDNAGKDDITDFFMKICNSLYR